MASESAHSSRTRGEVVAYFWYRAGELDHKIREAGEQKYVPTNINYGQPH